METQPTMLSGSVVGQQCSRTGSGSGEAVGGRRGGGGAEASALTLVVTGGLDGRVVFLVVGLADTLLRELLPFFVASFLADWRQWSVNKENSDCRGNVVPCAGSHRSDSTGKPAGGVVKVAWVSALAKVTGVVAVLSLAGLEAGWRRGVGRVWRRPCATDVWMVVSDWATDHDGRVVGVPSEILAQGFFGLTVTTILGQQ
jgi:hypothetical protein